MVGTEPAGACSCASPVADVEAAAHADVVFTGTLVDVATPSTPPLALPVRRFVFEVDEVLKGSAADRQPVVSSGDGASCGLEIGGHGRFVVFATTRSDGLGGHLEEGALYSHLCSGTRALVGAAWAEDLRKDLSDAGADDGGRWGAWLAALGAGGVVTLVVAASVLRGRTGGATGT